MNKRDNIHYTTRKIDGYNLPFNFIISEREAGKSTAIWLDKCWKAFKEYGQTTIVIRRKVVHITDAYINDIAKVINKFNDNQIVFKYAKGSIKDGIVDIYVNDKQFIRIVALSIDITGVKSTMVTNLRYIVFDEFICNPKFGEKYLKNEAFKFMEVYNTYQRESPNLKCYFLGNPYSLYNPYFIFFNVRTKDIQRGSILSDKKSWVIEAYEITEELKKKILEKNPLYQFDNSYTRYAFGGEAVNDANIIIMDKCPENYQLNFIFKAEGKYLGLYQNQYFLDGENKYYCSYLNANEISKRRDIYAFDFDELVDQTIMLSPEERFKFQKIKAAMRRRLIAFNTIECYYLMEEVYNNL